VVDSVERVTGRTVPVTIGGRREGDPAILFASSDKIRRTLGWTPRYEEIDVIVETAWRWREAHPRGYDDRGARTEDRGTQDQGTKDRGTQGRRD
jgi:UDP-glucose 4-epimerase